MDSLTSVLGILRLQSCLYFRRSFAPPWGMHMDATLFAQFHLVTRGACLLRIDQGQRSTCLMSAGDVIVLPHGAAHSLLANASCKTLPGKQVLDAHQNGEALFGAGEPSAELVCGHFELDRAIEHPLFASLPPLIHLKASELGAAGPTSALAQMLADEAGREQPGAMLVTTKLAEALFVLVLRAYIEQAQPATGFLAAVHDPRIGRALRAIHAEERHALSVEGIARMAGMSRSAFTQRFKELVGLSPMGYVENWRLNWARDRIVSTDEPVEEIAGRIGYESASAFYRAFKKKFSMPPGRLRRTIWSGGKRGSST